MDRSIWDPQAEILVMMIPRAVDYMYRMEEHWERFDISVGYVFSSCFIVIA
jgi:hypothetical protein